MCTLTSQMNFNGRIYKDPEEINVGWKNYFSDLYIPSQHVSFITENNTRAEMELSSICNSRDI